MDSFLCRMAPIYIYVEWHRFNTDRRCGSLPGSTPGSDKTSGQGHFFFSFELGGRCAEIFFKHL